MTVTADATSLIGHIHNLAVDPAFHSRGAGRALIEAAEAWMEAQGMAVAKIDTAETNAVGRWLYPASGYGELVREINYAKPLVPRPPAELPANLRALEALVAAKAPANASVSWWAEEHGVGAVSSANAAQAWPVASAIKAFMLAALYREQKDAWESVPPELPRILAREAGFEAPVAMWDPTQPEWEAYKVPTGTLERVVATLAGYSYRMLAQGMMGTTSMQVIGNPAYNTCANIVTLLLGGPEAATAKVRALDPTGGLDAVRVGRYQLTARTDANENVASCASLGRCASERPISHARSFAYSHTHSHAYLRSIFHTFSHARGIFHAFAACAPCSTPPSPK